MRKNREYNLDCDRIRRRTKGLRVMLVAFGLLMSPIVYDGSRVCAARWRSMYHGDEYVETPVFDTLNEMWYDASRAVQATIHPYFYNLPWKTNIVVPIAAGWAVVTALLLRK